MPWRKQPLIPYLDLSGKIEKPSSQFGATGKTLSLKVHGPQITSAFKAITKNYPVIAISLNSPGGSPVQSHLLYQHIRFCKSMAERRLGQERVEVLVFVEDVAASGGYMIACAGDEVYANESSVVGSIGVIAPGFGAVELAKKLGVESRVMTAGESKLRSNPLEPVKEDDVRFKKKLLDDLHTQFIQIVKEGRGEKKTFMDNLALGGRGVFSGDVYLGGEAKELGLIDDIGYIHEVLHNKFGDEWELKNFGGNNSFFGPLAGFATANLGSWIGGTLVDSAAQEIESKLSAQGTSMTLR